MKVTSGSIVPLAPLPGTIILDAPSNHVRCDESGAIMVDGIESWIQRLVTIGKIEDGALLMQDTETGAEFYIRRVK